MDEIKEAEEFSRELDKLLAGQAPEPSGDEQAQDLRFAAKLLMLDASAQSRVKGKLKADLMAMPLAPAAPWYARPQARLGAFLAAGLAAVLLIPKGLEKARSHSLGEAPREWNFEAANYSDKTAPQGFKGMGSRVQTLDDTARVENLKKEASDQALSGGQEKDESFSPLQFMRMADGSAMGTAEEKNRADSSLLAMGPETAGPQASMGSMRGQVSAELRVEGGYGGGAGSGYKLSAKRRAVGAIRGLIQAPPAQEYGREGYEHIAENGFQKTVDHPLSTFSIDVDAASYANVRRILNEGRLPPADAVRIEELVNYFRYDYPEPKGEHPFSITTELAACPWNETHKLVRIGLKGKSIAKEALPPNNLVFLIDTSGSMNTPNKLPLLQKSLRLLIEQLRPQDRIAIVAYAGSAGVVLNSTPGSRKTEILESLDRLHAGGSTAGGAGIALAYQVAAENKMERGNNRVILATDGDFNVGLSSDGELVRMIEEKRGQGVFLTVLGFGAGNYQDAKMEKLANKGNGNYAYIDDIAEARKVLVREMGATLLTIAKDVKLQLEFNPSRVQAYRLIGYEDRMLKSEDFNNDKKDAGELGSGHTVTALYEVIPDGVKMDVPGVDALKYQKTRTAGIFASKDLLTVKFRYKEQAGETSKLIVNTLPDGGKKWSEASSDMRFAASVAGFGMLLRGSEFKGDLTYEKVRSSAREALGADEAGYRSEFVRLVEKAQSLDSRR